jgi:hypothetical protein
MCNQLKTLEWLVAKGADLNTQNREFRSALDIAQYQSNPEMVTLLHDAGAEVSVYVALLTGLLLYIHVRLCKLGMYLYG